MTWWKFLRKGRKGDAKVKPSRERVERGEKRERRRSEISTLPIWKSSYELNYEILFVNLKLKTH